jgi:sarcosine oxidase subunit beta
VLADLVIDGATITPLDAFSINRFTAVTAPSVA